MNIKTGLFSETLEICFLVAKNGQSLPEFLLKTIENIFLNQNHQDNDIVLAGLIISHMIIRDNRYITKAIYEKIEELFVDDSQFSIYLLDFIKTTISKGFKPKINCINKIITLTLSDNSELNLKSAEILIAISELLSDDSLDKLATQLTKIVDVRIQKKIVYILKIQFTRLDILTKATVTKTLIDVLEAGVSSDVETEVLSILRTQQTKEVMPQNLSQKLLTKSQRHILLEEKIDNNIKLSAIDCLLNQDHCFDTKDFKAMAKFVKILITDDNLSNSEILMNFFGICLKIKFSNNKLPVSFVDVLTNIFLNHQDDEIRQLALKVIQYFIDKNTIKLDKKNYLIALISREWNNDQKDIEKIKLIELLLNGKLPISLGNIDALCDFISKADFTVQNKIIKILVNEKEKISPTYFKTILDTLIEIVKHSSSKINDHNIIDLFINIFNQSDFHEEINQLISVFNEQFIVKNINYTNLTIFYRLISQGLFNDIDCQILLLIKNFNEIDEFGLKKNILDIAFNYVMNHEFSGISVLQEIVNLINIIDNPGYQSQEIVCQLINLLSVVKVFHSHFFETVKDKLVNYLSDQFNKKFPDYRHFLDEINVSDQTSFILIVLSSPHKRINDILKNTPSEDYIESLLCEDLITYSESKDQNCFSDDKYFHLMAKCLVNLDLLNKDNPYWRNQKIRFLWALKYKQSVEKLTITQIIDLLAMLYSYYDFRIENPEDLLIKHHVNESKAFWILEILSTSESFIDESSKEKIVDLCQTSPLSIIVIEELLAVLTTKIDINLFAECLQLIEKYQISESLLITLINKNTVETIDDLKKELIIQLISAQVNTLIGQFSGNKYRIDLLTTILCSLVNKGWNLSSLYNLLVSLGELEETEIIDMFEVSYLYKISEIDFYRIYNDKSSKTLVKRLYTHIAQQNFLETGNEKSVTELIAEIKRMPINQTNSQLISLLENDQLLSILLGSDNYSDQSKLTLSRFEGNDGRPIKQWTKSDIKKWAIYIRSIKSPQTLLLPEILAVIKRACLLHHGFEPRAVQLLALLFLYTRTEHKGRFAQIATGEGKSLIVAMLATIKALEGETVEVATSSPILAKRDADNYKRFYQLFGLKVACNGHEHRYVQGIKECYQEDIQIIYGDAANFQFDILRHEYSSLGTRGKRDFNTIIVDEVDNLLIDENAKIAMLSSTIPGMDLLIPILTTLWHKLQTIVISNSRSDQAYIAEVGQILTEYLHTIMDEKTNDFVAIPAHLKALAKIQAPKWIDSALLAHFTYKESRDYTIELNNSSRHVVVPVDFANTGVLQNGTSWNNGLHQFLQIKHGLEVYPESLTTNFFSNLALIDRYQKNVYGITGTLGSQESQKLLDDVYSIDFVDIPTYKNKRFIELSGEVIASSLDWQSKIVSSSIREATNGRVVLVVCESIEETNRIFEELRKKHSGQLYKYSKNGTLEEHFLKDLVNSGTIIVATNLAGRGTDIRISNEAINYGGLHVCCTFMPENERVETQIFGRASRNGEPGSGQLIINDLRPLSIEQLKSIRNENEKLELDKIRQYQLPRIRFKDKLFNEYMQLFKNLQEISGIKKIDESISSEWKLESSIHTYLKPELIKYNKFTIEERWGIWLKEHDLEYQENKESKFYDKVKEDFIIFKNTILQDYGKKSFINNASHWLNIANNFLKKANSSRYPLKKKELLQTAIKIYDYAISIDPNYACIANYNKAAALIALAEGDYREKAKKCLQTTCEIIKEKLLCKNQVIANLSENIRQLTAEYANKNKDKILTFRNDALEQIVENTQIINVFLNSVCLAIDRIERSQRLVDINLETKYTNETFSKLDKAASLQVITKEEKAKISITFHGLIKYNDCVTHYPLLKTMEKFEKNCPVKSRVNIIFDSKDLEVKDNVCSTLKKLLPINHKIDDNKSSNPEEKKSEEAKQERLIGSREHFLYAGKKIVSGISKATHAVSNAVSYVSKPIVDQVSDRWYDFPRAKKLLVTLELQQLVFPKIKSIIESEIKFDTSEPRVDLSLENFSLIIRQPNSKIFKLLKNDNELKQNIQVVMTTKDSSNDLHTASIMRDLKEVDCQPEVCDLVLSSNKKQDLLEFLNYLEENSKEQDNPQLLLTNFYLVFDKIPQQQANCLLDHSGSAARLIFKDLEKEDAKPVVKLADNQYDNAIFEFTGLTHKEAESLMLSADRPDPGLILNSKSIEIEFLKINPSLSLLLQYKDNGYDFLFDVAEKSPLPWRAMCLVSTLGVLQIGAGIALMTFTGGIGSTIGLGLITEGVSDLLRVAAAGHTRKLNMTDYLTQKSISMTISLVTAGIASYSSSLTMAGQEAASLTDEALLAARALRGTVNQAITASKHVAVQIGESIAAESARVVCSHISTKAADSLRPDIIKYTQQMFEKEIFSGHSKNVMYKIFAMDYFISGNQYSHYANCVKLAAQQAINSISLAIPGIELFDLNGFDKIYQIVREKLVEIERELDEFNVMLFKHFKSNQIDLKLDQVNEICLLLKKKAILSENCRIKMQSLKKYLRIKDQDMKTYIIDYDIDHYNFDDLDLGQYNQYKIKILTACLNCHYIINEDHSSQLNHFSKEIAELLASRFQSSVSTVANILGSAVAGMVNFGISAGTREIENQLITNSQISEQTLSQEMAEQKTTSASTSDLRKNSPDSKCTRNSNMRLAGDRPASGKWHRAGTRRKIRRHDHRIRAVKKSDQITELSEASKSKYHTYQHLAARKVNKHNQAVNMRRKWLKKENNTSTSNKPSLSRENFDSKEIKPFNFTMSSPDFNLLTTSVYIISKSCTEYYKIKLERSLREMGLIMGKTIEEILTKNWSMLSSILIDKKKIIRFLIALILSEKHCLHFECSLRESLTKGTIVQKDETRRAIERIDVTSEKILDLILESSTIDVNSIIKQYAGIDLDTNDNGRLLKKLISEYFQLNKDRSMLQQKFDSTLATLADKVNFDKFGDLLTERISVGQYSECGNLLRHGKLGEQGFILGSVIEKTGSIIDNLIKTHQLSIRADHAIKAALVKFAEKSLSEQKQLFDKYGKIADERKQMMYKAMKYLEKQNEKAIELYNDARKTPDREEKLLAMKFAENYRQGAQQSFSDLKEIAKSCAIDPQVLVECSRQMYNSTKVICETLVALGAQDVQKSEILSARISEAGAIGKSLLELNDSKSSSATIKNESTDSKDLTPKITYLEDKSSDISSAASDEHKDDKSVNNPAPELVEVKESKAAQKLKTQLGEMISKVYNRYSYKFNVSCLPKDKQIIIEFAGDFEKEVTRDRDTVKKDLGSLNNLLQDCLEELKVENYQAKANMIELRLTLGSESSAVIDQIARLLQEVGLLVKPRPQAIPPDSFFYHRSSDALPTDSKKLDLAACLMM